MCGPFSQPQFPSLTGNAQGLLLGRSGISFFSKCPRTRETGQYKSDRCLRLKAEVCMAREPSELTSQV